jgi:hypothetical protein
LQGNVEFGSIDYLEHLETEALDLLDEDLHSKDEARSTGFIGKSSEVQWLRAVALTQAERKDGNRDSSGPTRRPSYVASSEPISSFSFWTDCDDVNVDFYVDPHEMPQPDLAEHLGKFWMNNVLVGHMLTWHIRTCSAMLHVQGARLFSNPAS